MYGFQELGIVPQEWKSNAKEVQTGITYRFRAEITILMQRQQTKQVGNGMEPGILGLSGTGILRFQIARGLLLPLWETFRVP